VHGGGLGFLAVSMLNGISALFLAFSPIEPNPAQPDPARDTTP